MVKDGGSFFSMRLNHPSFKVTPLLHCGKLIFGYT
jgi:hypothetical protein